MRYELVAKLGKSEKLPAKRLFFFLKNESEVFYMTKMTKKAEAEKKRSLVKQQQRDAYDATIEDLFQDYYRHRRVVYKMNFIRGIFFGVGSAIGGTIVLALVVWILSFFVNFPVIGQFFKEFEQSIQQRR